jgi:hypothetical protein
VTSNADSGRDIPRSMDEVPHVAELGGAIGRRASVECKQGQHDLCADRDCLCRHHGRVIGDPIDPHPVPAAKWKGYNPWLVCSDCERPVYLADRWLHFDSSLNGRSEP